MEPRFIRLPSVPAWGVPEFEFRAEAFNLFNNVIFGTPSADFNTGTSFGTINSTYNTARELQLGGKFIF